MKEVSNMSTDSVANGGDGCVAEVLLIMIIICLTIFISL